MIGVIKWILLIVIVLLLGGLFAQMMQKDSGVLMVAWNGWVLETTFWTAIGLVLGLVLLFILLKAVWNKVAPHHLVNRYRGHRSRKIAKKETAIAIDSWLEGAEDRSLASLGKVIKAGGSDRLPAAVSLAVSLQSDDWETRYNHFVETDSELRLYADALKAERFWQLGQPEAFVEHMMAHFELRQVAWLRERLWQALLELGRTTELVPMINQAPHINPDARQNWLVKAVKAGFANHYGNESAGASFIKVVPKALRQLPDVMAAEVRYLVSIQQDDLAFKKLKTLLSQPKFLGFSDMLLSLKVENVTKLKFLESLQPETCGPAYCRTMGILNNREQLWGSAQSWFELAWGQGDQAAAVELGKLFEQRELHDQANRVYRELASKL